MADTGPLPTLMVRQQLQELPDWSLNDRALQAAYHFDSTAEALGFIANVGLLAERVDHHPHIDWRRETVYVIFPIRAMHGVAVQDFQLAERITVQAQNLEAIPVAVPSDRY